MHWVREKLHLPQYEFVSRNQHGDRFKYAGQKKISIARISCEMDDTGGLLKLILLSHTLDTPVRYDFEGEQEAYIEVVSAETLRRELI